VAIKLLSLKTLLPSSLPKSASCTYRRTVLVVGAGNSGAEIALEAVQSGHPTWLAGRHPGQLPFRIESTPGRRLVPIVMFAFRRVMTLDTPMGRKFHAARFHHGKPLVRTKVSDLENAGVQRVGRIVRMQDGLPVTEDNEVLSPQTVVWCTGFRPDFSWIDLPVARWGRLCGKSLRCFAGERLVLHRTGISILGRIINHPGSGSRRWLPDPSHGYAAQRSCLAGTRADRCVAEDQALHRLLTVCTGCNRGRPTETYVHVGFDNRAMKMSEDNGPKSLRLLAPHALAKRQLQDGGS
jgi:hypothetical protein